MCQTKLKPVSLPALPLWFAQRSPPAFGCLVGITPQVEESTVNSNHEAMKCTLFHTEGKVLNVTSKL